MSLIGDSIYKNLHGFIEGQSTVTQLTQVFHEIVVVVNLCFTSLLAQKVFFKVTLLYDKNAVVS